MIQDKWEIKQAIKNIKEEKITNLGGVPSQSAEIFQENVDLSGFIGSSFGGAPPTTQLASLGWKKLPKTASL